VEALGYYYDTFYLDDPCGTDTVTVFRLLPRFPGPTCSPYFLVPLDGGVTMLDARRDVSRVLFSPSRRSELIIHHPADLCSLHVAWDCDAPVNVEVVDRADHLLQVLARSPAHRDTIDWDG